MSAGTSYIVINSLFQPVLAVAMITSGALAGAGDTRPALIGTIWALWVVRLPLAYVLGITLGVGVEGVWWAMGSSLIVLAAYVLARWRSGTWRDVALKTTEVYRYHLKNLDDASRVRFLAEVRAPLMAMPDMQERVDATSLRYRGIEEDVIVRFNNNEFHLETVATENAS